MRNNIVLTQLQKILKSDNPELLDSRIKEFSCTKDPDVESFLKNNALYYERKGLSRTYLYIAKDSDKTRIAAYFSLAITATSFQGISKNRREKVLGFKPGRNTKDHFGGILVAQLGRDDKFSSKDINGREMIEDAEDFIEQGRYFLGGQIVYIDCKELLIKVYQESGYNLVIQTPYPSGYYKMFKPLPELN